MEKLFNLPTTAKWGLGLLGIATFGYAAGSFFRSGFWVFLAVLVVLLALSLSGYFLWKSWVRKKKNARLGEALQQHTSASPRGISDPGQRARLDDLRRKFEEGVKEYRSRGKDLYKLPWYVIVGPPGSGKTEAIRHCNVGFPPGMQDSLQGVGGTINMNWWFTNQAVILDTAGRLIFEEVKAGETSEWREFLSLLKRNRPNCPVNGLLLAISVDSLIKDSAEVIAQRAGRIAQQLDVIQRMLDVRFPVFVIVTKCDLMTGFREFFDGLTDPQLQHQILGWSNPDPLDAPFKPELVDQHLAAVTQQLRRCRLGLLRDPVAESPAIRRADEVDSLFALPQSLSLIGSRLRRYLETIFVAGEWSSKPLFLRGIYFTSSMREGTALDQELAQAIGVSVDDLPQGRAWERERAYFLRDLFIEKVFREKGLVTRASNTARLLRSRQIAFFSVGFVALAVFVVLAAKGMQDFRRGVGDQSTYWKRATKDWTDWETKTVWMPIISGSDGKYLGHEKLDGLPVSGVDRIQFHSQLKAFASKPLELGVFRPISRLGNLDAVRKKAQRIVFEGGVVRPLVEAARQKMVHAGAGDSPRPGQDAAALKREAAALMTLIQLESEVLNKTKEGMSEEAAVQFVAPLLNYLTETDGFAPSGADRELPQTFSWVYSEGDGRNNWPPDWLSAGRSLSKNQALDKGLESFITAVLESLKATEAGLKEFTGIRDDLKKFQRLENEFIANKEQNVGAVYSGLTNATASLAEIIKAATQSGVLHNNPFSLALAYQGLTAGNRAGFTNAFKPIQNAVSKAITTTLLAIPASEAGNRESGLLLFQQIKGRLDQVRIDVDKTINPLSPAETEELKELDKLYFAAGPNSNHLYAVRWNSYREAYSLGFEKPFAGQSWQPFLPWQNKSAQIKAGITNYQGELREKFAATGNYFLDRGYQNLLQQYLEQTRSHLLSRAGFPLVRWTGTPQTRILSLPELTAAKALLEQALNDFMRCNFKTSKPVAGLGADELESRMDSLQKVGMALFDTNSKLGTVKISLDKRASSTKSDDLWRGSWRYIGIKNKSRTDRSDPGDPTLADSVRLNESVNIDLFTTIVRPAADRSYSAGEWGALKLIHQFTDKENSPAGGKNWTVKVPITQFIGESPLPDMVQPGTIPLLLEFNVPFPDLDKWPTKEDLEKLTRL